MAKTRARPKASTSAGPARQPTPVRSGAWLARHRRWVLAGLALAAAVIRLIYFVQLNAGPLVWQHRWDQSDMSFFDVWAKEIAAGDVLTNQSLHPLHYWHVDLAKEYYASHAELRRQLDEQAGGEISDQQAAKILWDRWYGGKRFHQEPLYPYLMAMTYRLAGPDVRWVFAWQLLLGVFNVVLIYLLAWRLFGEWPGLLAGVLALLCGPMLMYEMVLLREVLITTLGLAAALLLCEALCRRRWPWWLACGVLLGLGMTAKATFALLAGPAVLIVAIVHIRSAPGLARSAGLTVVGILLALSPMIARNLAVGQPAFEGSSVGAITYICSNTAEYAPEAGFVTVSDAVPIMDKTDGKFAPAVLECWRTFPSFGAWLKQLGEKFTVAWHWYEIPGNTCYYYYRLHAPVLYLPANMRLIGPLALVGLVLGFRTLRRSWPLYLLAFSTLAGLMMFYTVSRFRMQMMAGLIPLAALAGVSLTQWLARRRWLIGGAGIAALLAAVVWINWPMKPQRTLYRPIDFWVPFSYYWMPQIREADAKGDYVRVAEMLEEVLQYSPDFVQALSDRNPPRTFNQRGFAEMAGQFHYSCMVNWQRANRYDRAAYHESHSQRLDRAIQAVEPSRKLQPPSGPASP